MTIDESKNLVHVDVTDANEDSGGNNHGLTWRVRIPSFITGTLKTNVLTLVYTLDRKLYFMIDYYRLFHGKKYRFTLDNNTVKVPVR